MTKTPAGNSVLPQLAVTCKIKADYFYQTFVQIDSEVLLNRHYAKPKTVICSCAIQLVRSIEKADYDDFFTLPENLLPSPIRVRQNRMESCHTHQFPKLYGQG
jgi:hypothetical protein